MAVFSQSVVAAIDPMAEDHGTSWALIMHFNAGGVFGLRISMGGFHMAGAIYGAVKQLAAMSAFVHKYLLFQILTYGSEDVHHLSGGAQRPGAMFHLAGNEI
ncbi:MAG: hypothetical protein A2136_10770 [Chloroflexi bacterium RBG_16_54_11]|nr:MAG: hypothetical protein A2136_10770 [Chloroflexi bacterium RBG_16_54_11]